MGNAMFNGAVTIVETSWRHYDICMLACVFEFARPTKTPARLFRLFARVCFVFVRLLLALLFAFYLLVAISRSNEREPILCITLPSGWRELL